MPEETEMDRIVDTFNENLRNDLREDGKFARDLLCYIMFHHKCMSKIIRTNTHTEYGMGNLQLYIQK